MVQRKQKPAGPKFCRETVGAGVLGAHSISLLVSFSWADLIGTNVSSLYLAASLLPLLALCMPPIQSKVGPRKCTRTQRGKHQLVHSFIHPSSRHSVPIYAWNCARPGGFREHRDLAFSLHCYGEAPSFLGPSLPLDSHPFSSSPINQAWALVILI